MYKRNQPFNLYKIKYLEPIKEIRKYYGREHNKNKNNKNLY